MKRRISLFLVLALVLSMVPTVFAAETTELISVTNETVTSAGYTFAYTAETAGTLTVTAGTCTPGWQYKVYGPDYESIPFSKWSSSHDHAITAGDWSVVFYAYSSAEAGYVDGTVSFTVSFTSSEDSGEVEKAEYEVSDTALVLGDNTLTLLDTAVTTIYEFEAPETAVYTFTAPEGAILGYWGAGSWFLTDPGSTTNTYEWTCTGVGQSAYIGVSGVEGEFNLNVAKTGDYTVVETPIVTYENKATLETFTVPEGATLGDYVDVYGDTHTAVLGDDGYYHLDSIDGDVLLVDMNYQDIVLSNALKSDRPVMYAYTTDENGDDVKYDIGAAVQEYEAVMDENGYYPLTEDLILFYDTYAVGASVYSFYVTGDYNEECVWMYCMRTMNMDNVVTEPSEPEVTDPEETDPTDPSEPETEPVDGEIVLNESVTGSSTKYVYTYTPATDGTLTITVGDGSADWNSDVVYFAGVTMTTVASASGTAAGTYTADVTAGTDYRVRVWSASGTAIPVTVVFKTAGATDPDETEPTEPEKNAYEVSTSELAVGSNTLTMLDTAVATVFKFKPTETGTYTITGPDGSVVGNWGTNASYLTDPGSTTNSCEWTCTGVGQSVYIGVSGVEGDITLTVEKQEEVTEPSEPETEETEPTTPSVPETPDDEDVPADAYYGITVDGTTTYYTASSGATLNSNLKAITGSAYVKFYKDMSLGSSYTIDVYNGNITLDLNGCTITSAYKAAGTLYVSGGTVTVVDTSAEGDGLLYNSSTGFGIEIYTGSVIMQGGNAQGAQGVKVWAASFELQGGKVSGTSYGINALANSTVTISGGEIIQETTGTFKYALFAASTATVTVTGGYFNGTVSGSGLTGKISGGYYTASVSSYVASGYELQDNDDATYIYKVVDPNATETEPSEPETEPSEPETEPSEPETEPSEPETEPSEPVESGTLISVTDEAVTATGYTFTYTAETAGTLTVTAGTCTPGWQYKVYGPNYESIPFSQWSSSHDHAITAGDWSVVFYAYSAAEAGYVDGTVSFTVTFTPAEGEGSGEVEKAEYEVSDTALAVGDNTLTLLDTAVTTIYVFEPTETGVYTFTAPEGAILGYWGAGSWFLTDPNSTTNTYEWTCTGVGQSAYIGVSGVEGAFTLNVAKTDDYEVVEIPIVVYENKAELNAFTIPQGATLGSYVDVYGETHTAVYNEADGYYHLDSADGPILLVDMDYMDIVLSDALRSDRPVMYAYTTDADGNTIKYDIGAAVQEYEAVMDANGYYPLTEDLILFYDTYAVGAGTYTFYVSGDYNEECVWMYCMRTMELAQNVAAVYDNGQQVGVYTSVAAAIEACAEGQYVVMIEDVVEDVVISGNVYLDLNGHTLTGNITGDGTLYGMDSATNDYDCADMGQIVGIVSCNVVSVCETDVSGEIMKYLTISGMNGISFHRFYVGITAVSLNPANIGFGYKAVFAGDEMVKGLLDSFGYSLWLGSNNPVTRSKTADQFVSEQVVTLWLNNFDIENYGEALVNAQVFMKLTDGTELVSAVSAYSMRSMVETIDANVAADTAAYTQEQLRAAACMILDSDIMQTWSVSNILNAVKPVAEVEQITVENEEMMIYDLVNGGVTDGTFTLGGAYTFTAVDTPETVVTSPYADWYADYYVSVDQVVQDGLYLAGNYGTFGWIAIPVPAGQAYSEFALLANTLGSWTYTQIVNEVGVFKCGVADTAGNNAGATITVELRLTNPENAEDYMVLNRIEMPL